MVGGEHLQQVYADPAPAADFGEQTFLGGMSLGGRVRLYLFLGLAMLSGLGFGGWELDRRLAQAADEATRARDLLEIAGKIERGVWQLREAERGYLLEGIPTHAERYDIHAAAIAGAMEILVARPDAQPLEDRLKRLGEALAHHGAGFHDLVAARRETPKAPPAEDLAGLVDKAAAEVEARVARPELPGLRNLWQRVRDQEKGLEASGDGMARMARSIESFNQALAGAPFGEKDRKGVADAIGAYRAAIEATLKARPQAPKGKVHLDGLFADEVLPQVDGLVSFAEERVLLAGQKEKTLRELVRLGVAGGGTGGLLLLVLFGSILMRSMTRPLRRLAEAGPRLLAGDEVVHIPALGNHDEIGEVARTLAKMRADLGETPRVRHEMDGLKADMARQLEEDRRRIQEIDALKGREKDLLDRIALLEAAPPPPPPLPPPPAEPVAAEPVSAPPPEPAARMGKLWSGTLSTVSRDVAMSSQSVSDAAFEAERTGTMIRGLTFAATRLKDAEALIAAIAEQANHLAFKANLGSGERPDAARNLIVLSSDPRHAAEREEGGAPARRVEAIRSAAAQAGEALRDVGAAVGEIKSAALDLAATTSEEALEVTTRLMEQSQFLRNMLDELVGKIHSRDDGSLSADQPPLLPSRRVE